MKNFSLEKWKEERKERGEKLKEILKKVAETLKKEGLPVNEFCRVAEKEFAKNNNGPYSPEEIEADIKWAQKEEERNLREKFNDPISSVEVLQAKKRETDGWRLEALFTYLWNKYFGQDFICLRTSLFDDLGKKRKGERGWFGGVDHIILDRQKGEVVCALDEVAEIRGERFAQKQEAIRRKNIQSQGAVLKYGVKKEKGGWHLGRLENIPVFYIALPPEVIKVAIGEMERLSSIDEKSARGTQLAHYLLLSLLTQLRGCLLDQRFLRIFGKEKLEKFEKTLESASEKVFSP